MKRTRVITAVVLIISLILCSTSASGITLEQIAESSDILLKSPISPELKERLKGAEEGDLIPVAIELKNTADLEKVNTEAIDRANVSVAEVNMMKAETANLTEEENMLRQVEVLEATDRIRKEKTEILKTHYTKYNAAFIQECKIPDNRIGFVSNLLPYIGYVLLTPGEIMAISQNKKVEGMYYAGDNQQEVAPVAEMNSAIDYPTLDEALEIIGGDVAVENGYTGAGIKVGIIESGNPDLSMLGTHANGVYLTGSGDHEIVATMLCEVIKRMAPDCSIYAASVSSINETLNKCDTLIGDYGVHVINITIWRQGDGRYNYYSKYLDHLVTFYDVSIVAATGGGLNGSNYVSMLALGENVIAVGAVVSQGTDPEAVDAFTPYESDVYTDRLNVVNKPDVCAPGFFDLYGGPFGTSLPATPFVTGTIVQMMGRNAGLIGKPETIKAALIASAYHNAGTDRSYVQGTLSSNQEGAGVIDAEFCYWVARNGRRAHFDTQNGQYLYTRDVWVDTTALPFRIACTWRITDESLINPNNYSDYDFDLVIYKDGVRVAGSGAYSSQPLLDNGQVNSSIKVLNYEVIELSPEILQTYGAGTYRVEIWLLNYGDTVATPGFRIGLAWEQPNV